MNAIQKHRKMIADEYRSGVTFAALLKKFPGMGPKGIMTALQENSVTLRSEDKIRL